MTVVLRVGGGVEGVAAGALGGDLLDWETVSRAVGVADGDARVAVVERAGVLARALAVETGEPVHVVDGSAVRVVRPPEPTPWATGLVLSGAAAVVALVALLVLTRGVQQLSGLLALVANVVVVGGLAPSAWLARTVPVWRWVALGGAAGTALAWSWIALTALT